MLTVLSAYMHETCINPLCIHARNMHNFTVTWPHMLVKASGSLTYAWPAKLTTQTRHRPHANAKPSTSPKRPQVIDHTRHQALCWPMSCPTGSHTFIEVHNYLPNLTPLTFAADRHQPLSTYMSESRHLRDAASPSTPFSMASNHACRAPHESRISLQLGQGISLLAKVTVCFASHGLVTIVSPWSFFSIAHLLPIAPDLPLVLD